MKGLLYKDFHNLRQQGRVYLGIVLLWLVISVTNGDGSFFSGVMALLGVLLTLTSVAYDERAHWDRYALTLPVTRNQIVFERYIFGASCICICCAAATAVSVLLAPEDARTVLITSAAFVSLGFLFLAIVLPLILRFGTEKARYLLMAVVLAPTLAVALLKNANIPMPDDAAVERFLLLGLPAAAALSMAVSVPASLAIYRRKEF